MSVVIFPDLLQKKSRAFLRKSIAFSVLSLTLPTFAVDRTWSGATSNLWTLDANWAAGVRPGGSDIAVFSGVTSSTDTNGNYGVQGARFTGTGNHTVGGTGILALGTSGIEVLGTTQVVTFSKTVRPNKNLTIRNDGTLNFNSPLQLEGSQTDSNILYTVTFDGSGNTTVDSLSRRRSNYDMSLIKNGTGTVILSKTSDNQEAAYDSSVDANGSTGYIKGDITINNGLLLANNPTGSATGGGNITINASGRIGGTGSITGGSAKNITLTSGTLLVGATHGAGGSAQDFQLGSSSSFALAGITSTNVGIGLHGSLQFDIMGAGSLNALTNTSYNTLANNDLLRLYTTGALSLDNSTVYLAAANTTGWAEGQSWKLIDWTNATGTFSASNLLLGTTTIGGWNLTGTANSTGYFVTASAVPEPSRALLFAAGMMGLLFVRKRRAM